MNQLFRRPRARPPAATVHTSPGTMAVRPRRNGGLRPDRRGRRRAPTAHQVTPAWRTISASSAGEPSGRWSRTRSTTSHPAVRPPGRHSVTSERRGSGRGRAPTRGLHPSLTTTSNWDMRRRRRREGDRADTEGGAGTPTDHRHPRARHLAPHGRSGSTVVEHSEVAPYRHRFDARRESATCAPPPDRRSVSGSCSWTGGRVAGRAGLRRWHPPRLLRRVPERVRRGPRPA